MSGSVRSISPQSARTHSRASMSGTGPFRRANSKTGVSSRSILQDITNKKPAKESIVMKATAAQLNRKLTRAPASTSSIVPSIGSIPTRRSISSVFEADIDSPIESGMKLPIDDFSPVGVNPHRFNYLVAARDALTSGGTMHQTRICSSFTRSDVTAEYESKVIDMDAMRAAESTKNVAEVEWYEEIPDISISCLSIESIDVIDNHPINSIEDEYLAERLAHLEQINQGLHEKLVATESECRRMQQEIEGSVAFPIVRRVHEENGDSSHNRSNQQNDLHLELNEKKMEVENLTISLHERTAQVAELEQVALSMEQMNTGLSSELNSALGMLDEAREAAARAESDLARGSSKESLSKETQAALSAKQLALTNMEETVQQLNVELKKQSQLLSDYQNRVKNLEILKTSNTEKIRQLEAERRDALAKVSKLSSSEKQVQAVQHNLDAKMEELKATEMRADLLESELKYKDEELMMLLQSSVQSSDIAAKKLEKVEDQLTTKTAALKNANDTNASYLKRNTLLEHREQELLMEKENHVAQIEDLQDALRTAAIERDRLDESKSALEKEIKKCHAKISDLEDSLKSTVEVHMNRLTEQKEAHTTYLKTRKELSAAKARMTEMQSTIQRLRLNATTLSSSRSPSFSMASPFSGGSAPVSPHDSDIIPAPTPPGSSTGQASALSSTISLLESQVFLLEGQCKESMIENDRLREKFEAKERDIETITEELHRSRSSLEKQLKQSTESESELASKVCDLNAQLEQLMSYSMKLTGELSNCKENEKNQEVSIHKLESEISTLRQNLAHASNPQREEEVACTLKARDEEVELLKAKLVELEADYEKAEESLSKAKQSKIRRYNKYVNLQQDYQLVVAQVERLVSENSDLRQRHKVFVKTVEAALVGGEGKIALDKFKDRETLPGSEAQNRSILEMSQDLLDAHNAGSTLSDIEDASDEEDLDVSPQRCF